MGNNQYRIPCHATRNMDISIPLEKKINKTQFVSQNKLASFSSEVLKLNFKQKKQLTPWFQRIMSGVAYIWTDFTYFFSLYIHTLHISRVQNVRFYVWININVLSQACSANYTILNLYTFLIIVLLLL